MSNYLYDPKARDLYHQSLKSLSCPHSRLVRGLVEKRSVEKEIWLSRHIEHCELCRTELQLASEQERLLASHIPLEVIPADFLAEMEALVQVEMKRIRTERSKVRYSLKVGLDSLKQVAGKRIFWLSIFFFALMALKLSAINL